MKKKIFILIGVLFLLPIYTSAQVIISEVFFDSPLYEKMKPKIGVDLKGIHHNGEFVELYNNSSAPVDISGYKVGVKLYGYGLFTFPKNTVCKPKECILVAFQHPNSPDFKLESLFKGLNCRIFYHSAFVLGNQGNCVNLMDRSGRIISQIEYKKLLSRNYQQTRKSVHSKGLLGNLLMDMPSQFYIGDANPGQYDISKSDSYDVELKELLPESARISNTSQVVGEIKSTASVTPTGAANVEVPLTFPSGINGMEPKLSIAYNSQGGIGMLGYGTELSGLSAISRTEKSKFFDGERERVKFKEDGAFVMDGQRLIKNANGNYETYIYSLTKIEPIGKIGNGPAYFKVTSPQGVVAEYGLEEDSRIQTEDGSNVLAWKISKVTDLNGNTVQYKYTTDRSQGSYIKEIIYGENGDIKISFNYVNNNIPISSFVDGSFFNANLLLSGIAVNTGQTQYEKYSFNYSNTHLSKILERSINGEELALNCKWGGFTEESKWGKILEVEEKGNSYFVSGDLTGDGKIDLVRFYSNKNDNYLEIFIQENGEYVLKLQEQIVGNGPESVSSLLGLIDMNNDGNAEIVIITQSKYKSLVMANIRYYDYSENLAPKLDNVFIERFELEADDGILLPVNLDNDAIPDFVFVGKNGRSLSESSVDKSLKTLNLSIGDIDKAIPFDYDGDGISELLVRSNDKWIITSMDNSLSKELINDADYTFAKVLDINNDGLEDIVFISKYAVAKCFINRGNLIFDEKIVDSIQKYISDLISEYALGFELKDIDICGSDYNNDSYNDLFVNFDLIWNTVVPVPGVFPPIYQPAEGKNNIIMRLLGNGNDYRADCLSKHDLYDRQILSDDFDNDGIQEIAVVINGNEIQKYGANVSKRNLLYSIDNNGITKVIFDYDFASNNGLHNCPVNISEGNVLRYINVPVPLVKELGKPNGQGKICSSTYKYYNGRYHTDGLGMLGFEKIEQCETVEGNTSKTLTSTALDNSVFIPLTQKVISYTNGIKTATQQAGYDIRVGDDRIVRMNKTKDISINELDGLETIKTYAYDDKGRPISETETYDDGSYKKVEYGNYEEKYNQPQTETKTQKHFQDGTVFVQQTTKVYDDKSNLISSIEFANTSSPVTTTYVYDDKGRALEKKTSGKNVEDVAESYSYELVEGKRKITTRQALSTTESYYNLLTGNLEKESIKLTNGPEAQITLYYYDGFGRETSVVYPNNKISKQTLSWNTGGKGYYAIKKEMTGEAPVTKYFDVLGREIYSNVKQGDVNVENATLYDAFGRKTAEISMHPRKSGWTKYEYCRDGRLESVLTHTGKKEVYEYRKRNIIILRNEKRYLKSLDSWGNILNQTDPLELTIYNTYASNGQVVRTSVGDHEITMSYDDRGNKLSMNDPDIGVVTYTYDGYGRAKTYSDPKGSYKLTYDNLGRLKQKLFSTGREVNYTYVDSGNGVGLVKEVSVKDESRQSFEYNKYGQILKKTETIDNQQFVYSNEYDAWGRLTKHTAPGKYVLKYAYDDNDGRLLNVQDNNGKILWKNVRYIPGREEVCQYGNQQTYTTLSSENESERILRYTKQDGSTLLEMKYGLDPIQGNVLNRNEKYNGKTFTEQFEYDEMDRLIDVSGNSSMHISFDGGGNILSKSDMGEYRYNDAVRTHALTDIESPSDVLKNLPAQKIEYTEFNKVSLIEEGHYKMSFVYNADEQRIKSELYKSGSLIRVIYYGDGYEKHINVNSNIKEYTYLDADGGYFGMHLSNSSGYWSISSLYYFHADLLGSLIAISNGSGNIAERRSYDAWGRRRNPDNWSDYKNAGTLNLTLIGYTFQEEMPEFNLINLNGRLYDPLLGRMLSPDPFIQDPDNSQNYNRYSYAWNNPMKYTDPDGNFILGFFIPVIGSIIDGALWNAVMYSIQAKSNWSFGGFFRSMTIGAISAGFGVASGGTVGGAGFISGFINGAVSGFVGGLIGGSLNAWADGATFMQGLKAGLKSGGIGAASSALIGGVVGGVQAYKNSGDFWTGKGTALADYSSIKSTTNKIEVGEGMEYSNKYANEFSDKSFGKNIKGVKSLIADGRMPNNCIKDGDYVKVGNGYANGITVSRGIGKGSDVYLFKSAFISREQLYMTMGHEYLHARFYNLGLINGREQHSVIYNWEYQQAKAWNYKVALYSQRNNSINYISSKYAKAFSPFSIKTERPW